MEPRRCLGYPAFISLTFVRRLRVEGLEAGDEGPWIDAGSLPADTADQLAVLGTLSTTSLGPAEAAERFASGGFDDHVKHFDEMGLVPVELWDVLDGSEVAFTLWLYGVDGGVVFSRRTSKPKSQKRSRESAKEKNATTA